MPTRVSPIAALAFVLCAAGLAELIVVVGTREGRASKSWPTTEGVVVSGHVEKIGHQHANNSSYFRYRPVIEYTYAVAGSEYSGHEVLPDDGDTSEDEATFLVRERPSGSKVPVYYDQSNPRHAVLVRGSNMTGAMWVPPLVALPFLGMILWRAARYQDVFGRA